jgi:uncharacterized protein YjbI with pentapeptide repeats
MAQCKYYDICGLDALEDTEEGRCILHSENPEKNITAFGAALAEHRKRRPVTFSHFVFPDETSFKEVEFRGATSFQHAKFLGGTDFTRAKFLRNTDFTHCKFARSAPAALFRGTMFSAKADFSFAAFGSGADFSGCTFASECTQPSSAVLFSMTDFGARATFCETKFERSVIFHGATFAGIAEFHKATFHEAGASFRRATFKRAYFAGVEFPCHPSFSQAQFIQAPDFSRTIFNKGASFQHAEFALSLSPDKPPSKEPASGNGEESNPAEQPIVFWYAAFEGDADFYDAKFYCRATFKAAQFGERVTFRYAEFDEEVDFQKAVFHGRASFIDAVFGRSVDFTSAEFRGETFFVSNKADTQIFSGASVDMRSMLIDPLDSLHIGDADLRKCQFVGTDLRKAVFTGVTWPRIGDRDAVYDEIVPFPEGVPRPWAYIERLYRELKQNYEDRRDYGRAGDFHFGEKEMRLKQSKPFSGLWFWLKLYKWVSGYGESWLRPLGWAALLLVTSTIGYLHFGLTVIEGYRPLDWTNGGDRLEALYYAFRVMALLRPGDLMPIGLSRVIQTIDSVLGPILIGLFALALRQKLKR